MEKYVFLDRDGVINEELGTYTTTSEQWRWADGAFSGIKKLHDAGFKIIVITNQACISKGLQTVEGLEKLHEFMKKHIRGETDAEITDIFYCPHTTEDGCSCRKPKPGLILAAAQKYDIDLAQSFFIGDSLRDMEAGRRAGVHTIYITSGKGADSERTLFESGEYEARSLADASDIVIQNVQKNN